MAGFKLQSRSEEETGLIGERLGGIIPDGTAVLLYGEIGAGKTCFARGLAKGLGLDPDDVASPTFTLVHEHEGGRTMYHMDLYRLKGAKEAEEAGLYEYFREDAVAVVEWADPISELIGDDAVKVRISVDDNRNGRTIEIELPAKLEKAWESGCSALR